jgi:hypothetical protein
MHRHQVLPAFILVIKHLQWPEKSTEVQWSVNGLLNEVKSSILVSADRIRSSRSVHAMPEAAWRIVSYLTCDSVSLSRLSMNRSILAWLPLAHAMSHANDSAHHWMEQLRQVLSTASCTTLPYAESSLNIE